MELRDYLHVARKRWLLIIAVTIVVTGLAAAWTYTSTKQYQSSARLFISTPATATSSGNDAYQGSLYSQQRVQSYADMVGSLDLSQSVINQLSLNMTPAALAGSISATAVPNTVLLDVSVTNKDPLLAQQLDQAVVAGLVARISELETPPNGTIPLIKATVIDTPRISTTPVSPKPTRNLALGLLVGLLLGFGLAVLLEVLDNTVKSLRDIHGHDDIPQLGALAYDSGVSKHPLITGIPANSPRSEAFRVLRTNLQFIDVDSPSKALVITSAVPGEGKSTTAANVALALAQTGKRVLLVDGDLRRPRMGAMFGLVSEVGLTNLLVGNIELNDAIQRDEESGLDVLTAGPVPPNPAEMLQSQAMNDLIGKLRGSYEVVIIDAPPLLPVTDAALLAAQTDGAVLVVRQNKTTRDQLLGATERLHSVDANLLGGVLNMVRKRRSGGAYGYGYGYTYGYGYHADK